METDTKIGKGLLTKPRDLKDYVKGVVSAVPYIVRNQTANWKNYLPTYQTQKYKFDTNECWDLATMNSLETQLNYLLATNRIPDETLKWCKDNGYIDEQGSFAFSERFIYVISGVFDNGNWITAAPELIRKNGLLPRRDLNYTQERSEQFWTEYDMCSDYGNPASVTSEMTIKAKEFLKYFSISYEWIGKENHMPPLLAIKSTLMMSPALIGIPVCMQTYNSGNVKYCGEKRAAHCVTLYNIAGGGIFEFFDQYHPEDKTLSSDYYIPQVLNVVIEPILLAPPFTPPVTAEPYPQNATTSFWESITKFFKSFFSSQNT